MVIFSWFVVGPHPHDLPALASLAPLLRSHSLLGHVQSLSVVLLTLDSDCRLRLPTQTADCELATTTDCRLSKPMRPVGAD